MFRPLMLLAALAVAAPAFPVASEEAPTALTGRFLLTSDQNEGFVRLDTKTGAVSHCGQKDGTWFCEPLAEAGLSAELATLNDRVADLSAGLDRLSDRVDGLAAEIAASERVAPPASDVATVEPGIADRVLGKFLDMVRTIKYRQRGEG